MPLVPVWIRRARSSASGVGVSTRTDYAVSKISRAAADRRVFPPSVMVEIKALACELPSRLGLPLARWSLAELRREAMAQGLVAQISGTTLWRWLSQDALRPWRHRCWIFPRDPAFAAKAGRILDLYQRRWDNKALGPRDYVLCADEKTSIQARRRKHPSLPPAPGRPIYVEHEYARTGAWAYIAAWDVHRAKLFGRCERKTGIVPFGRLVAQIMRQQPYRSARRVFWIVEMAPLTAVSAPPLGCAPNGPISSSFTPRSTPAGSTRSRSISPLSSASSSRPTILRTSPRFESS